MAGVVNPNQIDVQYRPKSGGHYGCFCHVIGLAESFRLVRWFQIALCVLMIRLAGGQWHGTIIKIIYNYGITKIVEINTIRWIIQFQFSDKSAVLFAFCCWRVGATHGRNRNFYVELDSLIYLLKLFCQQSNAVLIITMNLSLSRAMLGLGFVDRDRR